MADSMRIDAEELLIPTFVIACNPTIKINEIRTKRYYIVDREKARRTAESLFDICGYISPEHWPEWEVEINDKKFIVKAETSQQAIEIAKRLNDDM